MSAIELDPNLAVAHGSASLALMFMGELEEAIERAKRGRELSEHPWHLGSIGHMQGLAGNSDEARSILAELTRMRSERYVPPRAIAIVYLGLGDLDAAIDWLIRGAEMRDPGVNYWEIRAEHTDGLRTHPRYPELLRLTRLEPQG